MLMMCSVGNIIVHYMVFQKKENKFRKAQLSFDSRYIKKFIMNSNSFSSKKSKHNKSPTFTTTVDVPKRNFADTLP